MELINTLINWVTTNANSLIEYVNSLDGTGRLLVGLGCGFVGAIIGYLLFRGKTDFDGLVIVMVLTLLTGGIGLFIFITIYFEEYLISVFDKIKSAYNKKYPDCKSYYGIEDEFD